MPRALLNDGTQRPTVTSCGGQWRVLKRSTTARRMWSWRYGRSALSLRNDSRRYCASPSGLILDSNWKRYRVSSHLVTNSGQCHLTEKAGYRPPSEQQGLQVLLHHAYFPWPWKLPPDAFREFITDTFLARAANDEEIGHIPDVCIAGEVRAPLHERKACQFPSAQTRKGYRFGSVQYGGSGLYSNLPSLLSDCCTKSVKSWM